MEEANYEHIDPLTYDYKIGCEMLKTLDKPLVSLSEEVLDI